MNLLSRSALITAHMLVCAAVVPVAVLAQVVPGLAGASDAFVMTLPLTDASVPARFRVTLERGSVDVLVHDQPTVRIEARGNFEPGVAPVDGMSVGNEVRVRSRVASDLIPVHLVVFVPRRAELGIRLLWGGSVTVSGVTGRFDVQTKEGFVHLDDVAGPAVVSTEIGSIRVDYAALPTDGRSSLVSGSGDVELYVPPDASMSIDARSFFGDITTDLPIGHSPQTLPGGSGSWIRGSINRGGALITVVGTFGTVRLLSR